MTTRTGTAEEAYVNRYMEARELVAQLRDRLDDTPAPSEDFSPNWADVGDLAHLVAQLREIVEVED